MVKISILFFFGMALNAYCIALKTRGNECRLRQMLVGVEPIKQGVLQSFKALSERLAVINGYGPTESTICATFFPFQQANEPDRRTPIGRPAAGYRVHILDPHLQPLPIGVPGELYIGGAGLARGCLNRPGLTKDKFIPDPFPDPFHDKPGGRLYKTGGLCRWLPDGDIEFMGRIDHQVKIGGFRIEPGEIETVLTRCEHVGDAVVVAREGSSGDKRLAAYVTAEEGRNAPGPAELRKYLKASLPDYMIPTFFVIMDSLPSTPNGKIDRRALPDPDPSAIQNDYAAPRTEKEKILAGVWEETLGVERVGVDDNFFSLGGDSIVSIRIIARAAERGLFATVKQIFMHQTLAELAAAAETEKKSKGTGILRCIQSPPC